MRTLSISRHRNSRSTTREGVIIPELVLVEEKPLDEKRLVPAGFVCDICGSRIEDSQRYLAKLLTPD
jgi:hypothetical protein